MGNVTLKNARLGGPPTVGNDLFGSATSSVGVNSTQQYPVFTVAVAKGRSNKATLGQGGVFKIVPTSTGVALFSGVVGNGSKITFSGPIGRLYAPERSDGFFDPTSLGYNNQVQDIFAEITDVPKAAMAESLMRKTINPNLPIYIPGNLRADLNAIVGTVIFADTEVEGSFGMINRKGVTSDIEYTPNLLVGGTLSAPVVAGSATPRPDAISTSLIVFLGGTVSSGTTAAAPSKVYGYTSTSYPQPIGVAKWMAENFISTKPVFSRPSDGYATPTTVARLVLSPTSDGLIEGSFVSTDKKSLEVAKNGLLNRIYAVIIAGNTRAGVGFILRGSIPPMAKIIGNLQGDPDVPTEGFRLEFFE
jgi:hypothetical protein